MLLITDEPAAMAAPERESAQDGVLDSVSVGVFFLKPPNAALRSVTSGGVIFQPDAEVAAWHMADVPMFLDKN